MKNYEVKKPVALEINSWDQEFHNIILADTQRMNAFKSAIYEQVKEGDVVLDLGTGTGILARFALEAGASKVYGIDFNETILKKAIGNLSSFGEKFIPILGNSLDITLPEKVDVIISETIGNFADNENCTVFLKDAKKRFLKQGGIMIPSTVKQIIVPVYVPLVNSEISHMQSMNYYEARIPQQDHLVEPIIVNEFIFNDEDNINYDKKITFTIKKDCEITGFKGWFVANLSNNIILDTKEVANDSSWNHFYMPITNLLCKSGSIIEIIITKNNDHYKINYKLYEKNSIR